MKVSISKRNGKAALKGNWGLSIGTMVLYTILVSGVILFITPLFSDTMERLDLVWAVLFTPVMSAGVRWLHLGLIDGEKLSISHIFDGFKFYGQLVFMNFLKGIIAILWAVIPTLFGAIIFVSLLENAASLGGAMMAITLYIAIPTVVVIIVLLKYAQAVYLFKNNAYLGVREALKESKELMKGSKMDYALLNLGYALWYLPAVMLLYAAWYQSVLALIPPALDGNPAATQIAANMSTLAIVYGAAISFYIVPQWNAAMAAFHRLLVPLESEENHKPAFVDEGSWLG